MRAALLHLDDALTPQGRLRQAVRQADGRILDYRDLGPSLRLWSRPPALERLRARLASALPASFGPLVVFAGSGDFHHVTPLLVERALAAAGSPPVTVLHFDNHPDWVKFSPGAHCGSWVRWAARLPQVRRVITVGVCSPDIEPPAARHADLEIIQDGRLEVYAYRAEFAPQAVTVGGRRWPTIEGMGEAAFADFLPGRIETEAVYVTVDKDLLRADEAGTNWDQGRTSVAFLKHLIERATAGRRLIGADVVGDWSRARYGGGVLAGLLKQGEAVLDQPWRRPAARLIARNEGVNLALLEHLQAVAR